MPQVVRKHSAHHCVIVDPVCHDLLVVSDEIRWVRLFVVHCELWMVGLEYLHPVCVYVFISSEGRHYINEVQTTSFLLLQWNAFF